MLLASQLLLIIAILLTTSKYKNTEGLQSIKNRLTLYIKTALDLQREDDHIETEDYSTESEEPISTKIDDLVILEKSAIEELKNIDDRSFDKGKPKRKKKPNSKINGRQEKTKPKPCLDPSLRQLEHIGRSSELLKTFKWVLTLRFLRPVLKFVVRRIFISSNSSDLPIELDETFNNSTKLQHGKLIESSYLIKIITSRKAEKVVRFKVARLNMLILKTRKVKPLQIIPELIEQDD